MKTKSLKLILVSIACIFLSCNNDESWKSYPLADSSYYKDSVRKLNEAVKFNKDIRYRKSLHPTEKFTFSESVDIFKSSDSTSDVIDIVPCYTKILVYGDPIYKDNDLWYYVKDNNNHLGYVNSKGLAMYHSQNTQLGYFLVMGIKEDSHFEEEGIAVIQRISLKNNQILESLYLSLMANRNVKEISSSSLRTIKNKFNENTIIVYTTSMESCPGTTVDCFIIDTGTKLQILAQGIGEGEGSWNNSATVYIPLKLDNGKVMLVANGEIDRNSDTRLGTLRVYPSPKDIGVPIENLIVIDKSEEEKEVDEDGNPISNKDGSYKVSSSERSTEFYNWNGKTLTKLKTLKN